MSAGQQNINKVTPHVLLQFKDILDKQTCAGKMQHKYYFILYVLPKKRKNLIRAASVEVKLRC